MEEGKSKSTKISPPHLAALPAALAVYWCISPRLTVYGLFRRWLWVQGRIQTGVGVGACIGARVNMMIDTTTSTAIELSSLVKVGRSIDPVAALNEPDQASAAPDAQVQPP